MDTTKAQPGGPAKPRYSSSFSIESLLSDSRPSRSSSPGSHPVITSSVSQHIPYSAPSMACPSAATGTFPSTQGAFHQHLPQLTTVQGGRLPQKRPSPDSNSTQTPIRRTSAKRSTPESSPRSPTPESDLEGPARKRAHLEEPSRDLCQSPLAEEEDLHRDAASPTTDSSSGSGSPTSDTLSSVRRKKNRTSFTSEQITQLERNFLHQRNLAAPERSRLARRLELSEQQIKTWFQNRRMKEKRQVKEGDQPSPLIMGTPTSVLTTPTGLMMSPVTTSLMTSHTMTPHSAQPTMSMSMSASPPMMHAGISGHVVAHDMFQGGHYPGFSAPHHMLPGAMAHQLPPPPTHHQYHHRMSDYSPMTSFSMGMPVMLQ